jgi:hypothetical protein
MTAATLNIGKLSGDRYRIAFETDAGRVVCEVSVRAGGRPDRRTPDERRQDALHRAKLLARAFHEAIVVG